MFDVFKELAVDPALVVGGSWFDIGGEASLKVAREGNKLYSQMLVKLHEENKAVLELKNEASNRVAEDIYTQILAETILLDWKNIAYKGAPLEYSKANAAMLLAHEDFRALVVKRSKELAAFRYASEAADAKK